MKSKNLSVFSDVITSITYDAASGVEGIQVVRGGDGIKKLLRGDGIEVEFLPNEKVSITIDVNINYGYPVPTVVATVQEKVKTAVESSTKYLVHSVNVQIMDVIFNN